MRSKLEYRMKGHESYVWEAHLVMEFWGLAGVGMVQRGKKEHCEWSWESEIGFIFDSRRHFTWCVRTLA